MRILVLGGYGTFGGRLIRLLANEPRFTLLIAGRSQAKAEAFAAGIIADAELVPCVVDRDGDLAAGFARLRPDIVVDATGPFQTYGDAPYRVAEAAVHAGIGYLDLADGADFVAGIEAYDAAAQARGVFVLSGVSTFPALSSAVVRRLTERWSRIDGIEAGLAPSPRAGLGGNVIRAILTYAGRPVTVIRDGRRATASALVDSRCLTVAPPGRLPLPKMRFVLVDVPDLHLTPNERPDLQGLWTGVATRPQFLLALLTACARLVQWRILPSLAPLTGLAKRTMRVFRQGEHRGGMVISARGMDGGGDPIERSWHMIAEGDDGPFIPSMAAEALIRKALDGKPPRPGARPAMREVELADYEAAFAKRRIVTGFRDTPPPGAPLYRRILGSAWDDLPDAIRRMHSELDGLTVTGAATVDRGISPLSRLIGAIVGFPNAGADIPVEVRFTEQDGGELWQRRFAGKPFSSFQKAGTGAFAALLSERFGPLEFGLALVVEDRKLRLVTRGWRAFGIPMPRFLAPGGDAFEHVENGVFHFHVEIRHPLTGLIVRYRGHLSDDRP